MEHVLTEKLCVLLSSFDEYELSVLPYEPDAVRTRALWLVPGEVRYDSLFVSGSRLEVRRYLLKLRHRSSSSADRLRAAKILESVALFGKKNIGDGMSLCPVGDVKLEDSDGDAGVFYLALDVSYISSDSTSDGTVKYYISFDGVSHFPLGVGITSFTRRWESRLYSRRFIHESFERHDSVGETVSYEFEFRTDCMDCALLPLLGKYTDIQVIRSMPDGEAELVSCVASHIEEDGAVCRGTLKPRGDMIYGKFDRKTGIFTEN